LHEYSERLLLGQLLRARCHWRAGILRGSLHNWRGLRLRMLHAREQHRRDRLRASRFLRQHVRRRWRFLHELGRLLRERELRDDQRRKLRGKLHEELGLRVQLLRTIEQ
jgi:hypothetical protein